MLIAIFVVLLLILFVLAPWLLGVAAAIAALISVPVMIGIAGGLVLALAWGLWKLMEGAVKRPATDPSFTLTDARKACQHCQLEIPADEHHCRHCGKLTK